MDKFFPSSHRLSLTFHNKESTRSTLICTTVKSSPNSSPRSRMNMVPRRSMICMWSSLKRSFHITKIRIYKGVARTSILILTRTVGFGQTLPRARTVQWFLFPSSICPSLFQKLRKIPYFKRLIFSTWATPSFLHFRTTPIASNLTASFLFLKHGEKARISF